MTIEKEAEAPKKEMYRVKMEVMAPIELTFRVLAESPEEALQLARMSHLTGTSRPNLNRMKKIKASVYKWFFTNILHTKKY